MAAASEVAQHSETQCEEQQAEGADDYDNRDGDDGEGAERVGGVTVHERLGLFVQLGDRPQCDDDNGERDDGAD